MTSGVGQRMAVTTDMHSRVFWATISLGRGSRSLANVEDDIHRGQNVALHLRRASLPAVARSAAGETDYSAGPTASQLRNKLPILQLSEPLQPALEIGGGQKAPAI